MASCENNECQCLPPFPNEVYSFVGTGDEHDPVSVLPTDSELTLTEIHELPSQ